MQEFTRYRRHQLGRQRLLASMQRVVDGVQRTILRGIPARRAPMQQRGAPRRLALQLAEKEFAKQLVQAAPWVGGGQRGQEQTAATHSVNHLLAVGALAHGVA